MAHATCDWPLCWEEPWAWFNPLGADIHLAFCKKHASWWLAMLRKGRNRSAKRRGA